MAVALFFTVVVVVGVVVVVVVPLLALEELVEDEVPKSCWAASRSWYIWSIAVW